MLDLDVFTYRTPCKRSTVYITNIDDSMWCMYDPRTREHHSTRDSMLARTWARNLIDDNHALVEHPPCEPVDHDYHYHNYLMSWRLLLVHGYDRALELFTKTIPPNFYTLRTYVPF